MMTKRDEANLMLLKSFQLSIAKRSDETEDNDKDNYRKRLNVSLHLVELSVLARK